MNAPDHESKPREAVTILKDIALVSVERRGTIGLPGVSGRVLVAVAQTHVPVLLFSQSSSEQSCCFAVPQNRAPRVAEAIQHELQDELEKQAVVRLQVRDDVVMITTNGTPIEDRALEAARIYGLLAEQGINVLAIAQGAARYSMSIIIEESGMARAICALTGLQADWGLDS